MRDENTVTEQGMSNLGINLLYVQPLRSTHALEDIFLYTAKNQIGINRQYVIEIRMQIKNQA